MYNNKKMYNLMKSFYKLSTYEVRIIDYLMQSKDEIIETTYSKLTEILGFDKKKNVSNVRKAILHLQDMDIVCIVTKHSGSTQETTNPMKGCFMVDNWMDNLLKGVN